MDYEWFVETLREPSQKWLADLMYSRRWAEWEGITIKTDKRSKEMEMISLGWILLDSLYSDDWLTCIYSFYYINISKLNGTTELDDCGKRR